MPEPIENTILTVLSRFSLNRVGIFGSYVRGENHLMSDLDILVSFKDSPSLLQFVQLENELSEALGRKVDLVSEGALTNSKMLESIKKDLKVIYHAQR